MWFEFRQAVHADLYDKLATPLWDEIPDDIAELPCVVVGRPGGQESTATPVVWDLALTVWVIGRRQQAGGSEAELLALLDDVFVAFGGTRGAGAFTLSRVVAQLVNIAGNDCPAYAVTVEQASATC